MKLRKTVTALLASSLLFAGSIFAADAAKETPKETKIPGTPGKCCVKAAAADKTCAHPCCVEAAKANKNCEKCGGTNPAPETT